MNPIDTPRRSLPQRRQIVIAAFIVAAAAIGAGFAGGTTGAAASATAKPRWLTVSGFWDGVTGPEVVDSASGRGWMGFVASQTRSTFGSVGLGRGRLSFAKAGLAAQRPIFIVGSLPSEAAARTLVCLSNDLYWLP